MRGCLHDCTAAMRWGSFGSIADMAATKASEFSAMLSGSPSSSSLLVMTFWNTVPPMATPMDMPSVRINAYMAAARPASSTRLTAWIPTLTLVSSIPWPMPKMARMTAHTGVFVSASRSTRRPQPMAVTTHPLQMAHR